MVDASTERFETMELFGKTVLFTDQFINPATVPPELLLYGLRHGDDDSEPATVEERVFINHFGDILTDSRIELVGTDYSPYREIASDDWSYLSEFMTIEEYIKNGGKSHGI